MANLTSRALFTYGIPACVAIATSYFWFKKKGTKQKTKQDPVEKGKLKESGLVAVVQAQERGVDSPGGETTTSTPKTGAAAEQPAGHLGNEFVVLKARSRDEDDVLLSSDASILLQHPHASKSTLSVDDDGGGDEEGELSKTDFTVDNCELITHSHELSSCQLPVAGGGECDSLARKDKLEETTDRAAVADNHLEERDSGPQSARISLSRESILTDESGRSNNSGSSTMVDSEAVMTSVGAKVSTASLDIAAKELDDDSDLEESQTAPTPLSPAVAVTTPHSGGGDVERQSPAVFPVVAAASCEEVDIVAAVDKCRSEEIEAVYDKTTPRDPHRASSSASMTTAAAAASTVSNSESCQVRKSSSLSLIEDVGAKLEQIQISGDSSTSAHLAPSSPSQQLTDNAQRENIVVDSPRATTQCPLHVAEQLEYPEFQLQRLSTTVGDTNTSAYGSANQSPSEDMLESPVASNFSDIHSEGSSDSGKGGSDIHMPNVESNSSSVVQNLQAYEFELPQELCGRLIGRHGQTVTYLKSKSNANIYVKRHPFNEQLKLCVVLGTQHDIESALHLIRRKFPLSKFPGVTLAQVNVPLTNGVPVPETLQLHLPEGIMCDVILSSLVNGGHFFVQQPTHPTYPSLSRLDQCMLSCYMQVGTPELPRPVEPGVICAAPMLGGWYRAQVAYIYDDSDDCEIKFVDYGGYSRVTISSLRQIRSDFMTLPFQASECYLANVIPVDEEAGWTLEAYATFEELAQGQILQAQVIAYAEDGIPYIHLYRIQGATTTFINRELVTRGVALWLEHDS